MMIRISMIAAALLAGLVVAHPAPARAQATSLLTLEVCNESGRDTTVAASFIEPGDTRWVTRGWFAVSNGGCIIVGSTNNANFYMYAETLNDGDLNWGGDHTLCVQYPGPFTRYEVNEGRTCESYEELVGFQPLRADQPGKYTWTLDP